MNEDEPMDTTTAYHYDVKKWKSSIRHFENELLFIERHLNQLESLPMHTVLSMRKKTKNKAMLLQEIKIEISAFEALLPNCALDGKGLLEIEEKHRVLLEKTERFHKELKSYLARILRYS
jgi:hypothetical protein